MAMSIAPLFIEVSTEVTTYPNPIKIEKSTERRFAFDVSAQDQYSRGDPVPKIITTLVDVAGTVIQPDDDGSVILRDGKMVIEVKESVQEIARRIKHEQKDAPAEERQISRPNHRLEHIREP